MATRWQTDYPGSLELGLVYSSADTFMAGQYNGLQEQGAHLLGNLDWRRFDGAESYWRVSLSDVGLDTREVEFRWGLPGRLSLRVGFDSQLQVRNDSGATPFRGSDTELVLPQQWATGQTTREWTALADSLQQFDRDLERNAWHLGLEAQLNDQWQLTSSLRYSTREGTGDVGAAIYVDAAAGDTVLLPSPIDHSTMDLDTTLGYSGTRLHLQGHLSWSEFDNHDQQLSWQNPYNSYGPTVSYPSGTGATGLAPDNRQSSAGLSGRYQFSRTLQLQFDVRLALAEQDQQFLPYSVNPALEAEEELPREHFDGEVATGNVRGKLHWQPTRKLKLELGYTLRDRDYSAPRDGYRYIPGDGGSQSRPALTVFNSTHELRTQAFELEAAYRLPLRSKLGLNYRFQEVTRENAATEETQEDRYTLNYRIQPWQSFRTTLELTWADRAADTYRWDQSYFALLDAALINDTPDNQRFTNHPLLSQHYLANREQQQARLDLNYLPAPGWSFNLNLLLREDDFDKSELGLTDATFESLQVSAGYAPHSSLLLSLHGGLDIYDAGQGSRAFRGGQEKNPFAVAGPLPQASDPTRNWRLTSRDESLVLGGQVQWQPVQELELELDYRFVDTNSTQDFGHVAAAGL
ncbi:MAG TPA: MtrB/PioB family decaheme-associated outer membrane protein, partial [Kineobactrum sp.]